MYKCISEVFVVIFWCVCSRDVYQWNWMNTTRNKPGKLQDNVVVKSYLAPSHPRVWTGENIFANDEIYNHKEFV